MRRRPLSQIFTRDTRLRNLVSPTFMPCISDIFPSLVSYLLPLLFLLLRHSYYLLVPSVSLFPAFYSPNRHLFCLNRWQLPSISCTVKPRYTGPMSNGNPPITNAPFNNKIPPITNEICWSLDFRYCGAQL